MMETKYIFEEKKIDGNTLMAYANRPQTIYEMFCRTVQTYPDREALKFGEIVLTYSELHQRMDESASFLKNEFQVGKGDRVAVFLKNDDTFPIAFLALSKLGAISVVLNTRLTKPELAYQLELTRPVAAVVDDETWDKSLDGLV
jgi:acyl-CoA synthetase (AMP-forming)/AMP-acid ligase II